VVVTPERIVLEAPADFVVLPMYDGELGVLPGRAPLIGRLGYGELRTQQGGVTHRYYVDGGFAQVRKNVVTVLTSRAMPAAEINVADAERHMADLRSGGPLKEEQQAAISRDLAMIRVARKTPATASH
jgi:F-type H+-transporting ATPase subunit epsilon